MILTDREIEIAIKGKLIIITPEPDADAYSSTSLDLCLDVKIKLWKSSKTKGVEPSVISPGDQGFSYVNIAAELTEDTSIASEGHVLEPGAFILGWTREKVQLPHMSRIAARVEGKSSLARLGVGMHVTAPTIHAGFGFNPKDPSHLGLQIQLEIFNVGNQVVVLDVGMPICQLILEEVREVTARGYQGRFSAQQSFGLSS